MHLPRTTILARATLAGLLMLALPTIADARSRHHRQTPPQQQPAETAATATTGQSRHHVESEHARAASQEVDKILDDKMKSICRGC